jgi:AcrR family transcriptional regulator
MPGQPTLRPRKHPRQARSKQMRANILAASTRVLRDQGPLRFTTLRVAAEAGISVGSLYQYFPNKQALIFALHSQNVEQAWIEIQAILDHEGWTAAEKIRRVAEFFFVAESDETRHMGAPLRDTEMFFPEQPEHQAMDTQVLQLFTSFIREELLSGASEAQIRFAARLLVTVIEHVGRAVAGYELDAESVRGWARECADMITNHIQTLAGGRIIGDGAAV